MLSRVFFFFFLFENRNIILLVLKLLNIRLKWYQFMKCYIRYYWKKKSYVINHILIFHYRIKIYFRRSFNYLTRRHLIAFLMLYTFKCVSLSVYDKRLILNHLLFLTSRIYYQWIWLVWNLCITIMQYINKDITKRV